MFIWFCGNLNWGCFSWDRNSVCSEAELQRASLDLGDLSWAPAPLGAHWSCLYQFRSSVSFTCFWPPGQCGDSVWTDAEPSSVTEAIIMQNPGFYSIVSYLAPSAQCWEGTLQHCISSLWPAVHHSLAFCLPCTIPGPAGSVPAKGDLLSVAHPTLSPKGPWCKRAALVCFLPYLGIRTQIPARPSSPVCPILVQWGPMFWYPG